MTFRLDIHIFPSGSLLDGDRLQRLQDALRVRAPGWASGLHVWRHREHERRVDVDESGALERATRCAIAERGSVLPKLRERFGTISARLTGSVELRGCNASLIVVLAVDEQRFAKVGDEWRWGNRIAIQICRPKVEDLPSVQWARETFEALCESLAPWYAHAEMTAEYDSKNIFREDGGMKAVGLDVSRALPGLYWLNFFGRPYCDAIGDDRLLKVDAGRVKRIDDGVLAEIFDDPRAWESLEYQESERRIRSAIGPEYFFTKVGGYGRAGIPTLGIG